LIFILVYLGMILGGFPYLKIGRSGIALVGAVALIAGHHITGRQTLECVDFGTLALLFGLMLLLPYATDPVSGPLMAIASGLSSNMIIIGSLANIIVVDAAASRGLKISFRDFAKVGIPLGLISMMLGALWIVAVHYLL
jgi:Na+/H+ antiporter NhaD/arsenite permease-like protein